MKNYRKIILLVLISVSLTFAGQIGPWSHFKAITSNFTVNPNDTLTINAGTEVRFDPGITMSIFGVVLSNGTSSDPVVFATLDPANHEWGGITINNDDPLQVSVFNSTTFVNIYSYGDGAISILESSVNFNNCKFLGNHADVHGGAVFVAAGNVNFTSCIFKNNSADQGGSVYIYNNPINAASAITISDCSFLTNTASQGGGIYVEDLDQPMPMIVNIENSKFYYNKATLNGGALYFNIASHIDLTFKYCEIKFNDAVESGGGIFTKLNGEAPNDVLPQRYLNLLVVQNSSTDGGGMFFHSGLINNPSELKFNNLTIAFNKATSLGPEQDGGGIHIVSNDNFPVINNSILWGNASTGEWNQFFVEDITGPNLNSIFSYCDIENGDWFGFEGLNVNPKFIRSPLVAENIFLNADRFDYHLSINSLCIDAGDPTFPTEERNPPINIGAYGNTTQATPPEGIADILSFGTMTDINVGDYGVTIIDFQGKSGKAILDNINLGQGSQLLLKNSLLLDTIAIKSFTTTPQKDTKIFTDDRIVVQKVIDVVDATTKILTITETALIHGVDMSDIQLTIEPDPQIRNNPSVNIYDTKIYTSGSLKNGIYIKDADFVDIENVTIDNFKAGIEVIYTGSNKNKAPGRITNNTVSFDSEPASKLEQQIGIQVQNGNIDIENNDIENGDIGIQMSNSSGRITNNTVSFDSEPASKAGEIFVAFDIINGSSGIIIEDNNIWIKDSTSTSITGINIDNSGASIYYNSLNFKNAFGQLRTGIMLNNVLSGTQIYNNTIYNPTVGIDNTPGFESVDFINNIIWNETADAGVSDTTNISFFNNNIKTLGNISENGNISSDPLFIDPTTNDLIIGISSPCINTGLIISEFHIANSNYFGTAPEIGAVEYYEITLTAPGDATISMTDSTFTLGWSTVSGASSYDIYSSNDPYGTYTLEANVVTTSWTDTDVTSAKKFYYVIASESSKNTGYVRNINPANIIKEGVMDKSRSYFDNK